MSSCALDPTLGSGKTRLRWSTGLRALGHHVDMFEPRDFEWWHGAGRALRFRQALGAARFVLERVRPGRYDLVEFFGGEFGLATARLAREPARPFIVAHTDGFELLAAERERQYEPRGPLARLYRRHTHERLSRAAFVHADAFVTGCELDRRRVIEMGLFAPDRARVVAPGLDAEYLGGGAAGPAEPRVAFTGSWIARKGIDVLVQVMGAVLRQRPQVVLDLYGTGAGAGIRELFPEPVRARVAVHGKLDNIGLARGLAAARVFFFPSQYEGFGMALAEAMACGCAPVTTPTGFGAELVHDEEALVCPFGDASCMHAAILSLLDDEARRARIAQAARRRVAAMTWESQVESLEATYLRWLHAP